jgi:hypothetical protein
VKDVNACVLELKANSSGEMVSNVEMNAPVIAIYDTAPKLASSTGHLIERFVLTSNNCQTADFPHNNRTNLRLEGIILI